MSTRTITRSMESDLDPEIVLSVLNDPARLPEWAPAFADKVEHNPQSGWRVTKGGDTFNVQVNVSTVAGTVDFLREMAGGKRGGAYARVFPRPLGGSVVVMTVPLAPAADPQQVAGVVEQELAALVSLGGRRRKAS
ncbi:MAG TPA: SRPBCC family protein [Verrucomicrobiae bacterium]|jgi:hypothetical protein|nr:SRPBCC family protein [Verrucomicrobiae bacterium]